MFCFPINHFTPVGGNRLQIKVYNVFITWNVFPASNHLHLGIWSRDFFCMRNANNTKTLEKNIYIFVLKCYVMWSDWMQIQLRKEHYSKGKWATLAWFHIGHSKWIRNSCNLNFQSIRSQWIIQSTDIQYKISIDWFYPLTMRMEKSVIKIQFKKHPRFLCLHRLKWPKGKLYQKWTLQFW